LAYSTKNGEDMRDMVTFALNYSLTSKQYFILANNRFVALFTHL